MEDVKDRNQLQYLGTGGKITLKWILMKWDGRAQTKVMWFLLGTCGRLLWTEK